MQAEPPRRGLRPDDRYARMLMLERLETLIEDMEELGVETLADARERAARLHVELDREDEP